MTDLPLPTIADAIGQRMAYRTYRRAMSNSRLALDHIDGDPRNNEMSNLRVVRWSENARRYEP